MLATFLLWLPVLAPASQSAADAASEKPNVLFWLIDTCRADRMSAFGHDRETTPFLERLAREGVVFESCYSQAPWTKPSMSSILTSQYPSRTGMTQLYSLLDQSFVTMPETLHGAGWHTVGFSANPVMGSFSAYTQGFAEFTESWLMVMGTTPMDYASGSAAKILKHAEQWVQRNEREPFFLYMHSLDPHEWYDPAPQYKEKFADPEGEDLFRLEWDALMEVHEQFVNTCTAETFEAAEVEPGPFLDYARSLYDADILASDHAIELLWERLRQEGFRDDLIVVVTGDHGTEFMDHGATSLGHSLYSEMLHVPLIFWAPRRLPAGLRFSEPVRSIDIYPTLLELMEIEVPEDLAGRSLMPWIRAGAATEERTVFSENVEEPLFSLMDNEKYSNGTMYAIRRGPWKLVVNVKPRLGMKLPRYELFRVDRDPTETKNLADEHPDLVQELRRELEEHVERNTALRVEAAASADRSTIDPRALEALEALGYVDSSDDDD